MTEPTTPFTDLAEQAQRVHTELALLKAAYDAALNAPGNLPQPVVAIGDGYPFRGPLGAVVAASEAWTRHLVDLAATVGDELTASATAIRLHVDRWRRDAGKPNSHTGGDTTDDRYARGMRNSLGGIGGDIAAALHPGVQLALANLLDAVAADDRDEVRASAGELSCLYLAARADDDDTYSGRTP